MFETEPDHIAALDSQALVELMKRLMLAESRLAGIPLRTASVPLQITVPDGGEDGSVEWSGGVPSTAYFPNRFTLFQAKAQHLTESRLRNEILMKPTKATPKLKPAIVDVLARKGAYIVFCRQPYVTNKRRSFVKTIKATIIEGGGNPKKANAIDVYDANAIADWTNTHPSVALWLASRRLGRPLGGFLTHEGRERSPDIAQVPWQKGDEPRYSPVNVRIPPADRRDPARNAWTFSQATEATLRHLGTDRAIVRVSGPSGFGKSRFVFEALSSGEEVADRIDNVSAIYADGSVSGDEAIKLSLELAETGYSAILVIDECSDELHRKLASNVQRINSRLRLVTIDIETKVLSAPDTLLIRVERASDELVRAIATGVAPDLSDSAMGFIAELSEGFPSMAVLAAQQKGDSHQVLASSSHILDRIVWGSKPQNPEAQRALESASLFDWIGIKGGVDSQANFVATEVAGIGSPLFAEYILSFKSRGIVLQRGDFVQIGPIPLAARLGLNRLSVLSDNQLNQTFDEAPIELKDGLLKRMKWLDSSPESSAFADYLLDPGRLGSLAAMNSEKGAKFLDRLVEFAPDSVSVAINNVLGQLSIDELVSVKDGRRSLVWALKKLVFRRESFDPSARMLLKLAAAENEDWGNNATGEFIGLFQLYLSGTEATPDERLKILDEGLASEDSRMRVVCVDALGRMLQTGHFSRGGGSEQIGSGRKLRDWLPKTYEDIRSFYREALSRLSDIAASSAPEAERAKGLLASHIRGLLSGLPVDDVGDMVRKVADHAGFWPEAITGISDWLYFDRAAAPADVANKVRELFDSLLPTDPVEEAILYTTGWSTDLHDPDTHYNPDDKHDFEYSARKAISVAKEIAKNKQLVKRAVSAMACRNANGQFPFARELICQIGDPVWLFELAISAAEETKNAVDRAFFGGLIAGADERDPDLARTLLELALDSPKLKAEAISLIGSGKLQPRDIKLVVSLLKAKAIPAWRCGSLSYGRGLDHLGVADILPLIEELEQHDSGGLWTAIEILDMYLYGGKRQPTKKLIAVMKRVLLAPALMNATRSNMDGHNLEQLVRRLASIGAITPAYARNLAKQCMRICRRGEDRTFYALDTSVRKVLEVLMGINPSEVWKEIAKKAISKRWDVRFYTEALLEPRHRDNHLGSGIAIPVPTSLLFSWVRENPKSRAAVAVPWFPMAVEGPDGSLEWTPEMEAFVSEFSDEPDVLNELAHRFYPSGWWGGLSPYLEPLIPLLERWRLHPNTKVRDWVGSSIDGLRKSILYEKKREEEDMVRLS